MVKIDTDDAIDTIDTFKMLVEEKEVAPYGGGED